MPRHIIGGIALSFCALLQASPAHGEVTAEQVNEAIRKGMEYLEKQQHPNGNWTEYEGEPGGMTALCALALLNSGRTIDDTSVRKALDYLQRLNDPDKTYSVSLMIMVFVQADPERYATRIERLAQWLEARQVTGNDTKGGWTYRGPVGRADSSNTQFAMLALHEAERAGVKISDRTWQLAWNYWTGPGMQKADGAYGYEAGHPVSGSMTAAAIASVIIARDRLQQGDATIQDGRVQCCGAQEPQPNLDLAMEWLGKHFSVERNPNSSSWLLYYLYALERVGRMSGQRFIGGHDWYREGCEYLIGKQDRLNNSWHGVSFIENNPLVGTSFALLFLSKGKRPVVMGKLQHGPPGIASSGDWDRHRRAVQNLVSRVEPVWKRDLSWQSIDFRVRAGGSNVTAADLLEAPVLFLSGSQALDFTADQKRVLKEYVENGGFIFAEACDGQGCDGKAFDTSFRQLMRDLFPESQLRKLSPDHAVWYAEKRVDPAHLPKDADFWLWGLDACCRTSVVYAPRSLSCYWELAGPYGDPKHQRKEEVLAVVNLGHNVLAYATSRELKDKLDRPQLAFSNPGGSSPRGSLVVPKLSHSAGADDAPNALMNLLAVMERQLEMRVDYEKRMIAPTDPKLYDYPLMFMHGRRAFRWSAAERKALKDYLDRGGFLFADAICANKEFADSLRAELKSMYPEASFSRIPPSHPLFSEEFHGFRLTQVMLRDPLLRVADERLDAKVVATTPLLEGLEIDGRMAVILSPYDISCALEKGASLDCKGYTAADAARLGANVLLYGLQQ
jgi:hypothetical protein